MALIKPIEELVGKDEKIQYQTKYHPLGLLWPAIFTIVGIIILVAAVPLANYAKGELDHTEEAAWWMAFLCGLFFGFLFFLGGGSDAIKALTIQIVVTDQQVFIKWGLIGIHTSKTYLNKIESVKDSQGILGRIFRFGSVTLVGTGGDRDTLSAVDNLRAFLPPLEKAIDAAKKA